MNELDSLSLCTEYTFSILQYQISAYIPPYSTLYRYCTSNIAKIYTNAVWQDSGFTFHYYFFLYLDSILLSKKAI